MKRRKKASLPRLTVLAMSRRDLLAFTEAVEKVRCLVGDLELVANRLGMLTRKRKPVAPAPEEGGVE